VKRKRVVIVGAGFGGLAAAKRLARTAVDVTVIDRSNHHLFQPLLYQVATAAIAPSDIAAATRSLFPSTHNVTVLMDEVVGVDHQARAVRTKDSGAVAYDYLILATGADYSFFGNDDWAAHAHVLKTMDGALTIRERLLAAFEKAERVTDPAARAPLLTTVVVGAGPTGVEMAGAIAELGRTMAADFRHIDAKQIRIILVEAGDRILPAFAPKQSRSALRALLELGVEVRLSTPVSHIDEAGATIDGELIPAANIIWSAGTRAREAASWLDVPAARNGGVIVEADCSIAGMPGVFAIGDVSSCRSPDGRALPGLAPVAKQQGRHVAAIIAAAVSGRQSPGAFHYRNWGMLAVIGRSKAVADFGTIKLSGYLAWLTWSLVHLMLLVDFRSRASVYLAWSYAWFTRGRIARLLTRQNVPQFPSTTVKEESR